MSPAKQLITFALLAALAFAGGCGEDGPVAWPPPDDGLSADQTSAQGAVFAYADAATEMNFDVYSALLHENFLFLPVDDDDFAWIPNGGWTRSIEVDAVGNMFDSSYISPETGENVDTIAMRLTVQSQQASPDVPNGVEVSTIMDVTALWAQNAGATAQVQMMFTVVPDDDGYFRIVQMQELDPAPIVPSIESTSWGLIKSAYRW